MVTGVLTAGSTIGEGARYIHARQIAQCRCRRMVALVLKARLIDQTCAVSLRVTHL